jgi:hypothetical protein
MEILGLPWRAVEVMIKVRISQRPHSLPFKLTQWSKGNDV